MAKQAPPLRQNKNNFFMFSVPEFTSICFVRDSGTRGKEG
jgi:hypothetical protein